MSFNYPYRVLYSDIDKFKQATFKALLQYCEDIAVKHSDDLDLGLNYYYREQKVWALTKWDIKFYRFPNYDANINITTNPSAFKKYVGERFFSVKDANGDLLAEGFTEWLFLSLTDKRPLVIPEIMYERFGIDREGVPSHEFERLKEIEYHTSTEFKVRRADIDTNQHVNNISYIEWALEVLPESITNNYQLSELRVDYKRETFYGERISSEVSVEFQNDSAVCHHRIRENGKVCTLLKTVWTKK